MFKLGHFSKDISFSKINRLQGLQGWISRLHGGGTMSVPKGG